MVNDLWLSGNVQVFIIQFVVKIAKFAVKRILLWASSIMKNMLALPAHVPLVAWLQ